MRAFGPGLKLFLVGMIAMARAFGAEPPVLDAPEARVNRALIGACDPGVVLSSEERDAVLKKLRISTAGRSLLAAFERQYGTLENLVIQWDRVSYSKVASSSGRALAAARDSRGRHGLGEGVCVHLTQALPAIEHVADLAHELTHVTRLDPKILRGETEDVREFVRARLSSRGGEAEAFATECEVKHEILKSWDSFCSPYVKQDVIDIRRVVADLYNGQLSASLTGETYPTLLTRQFQALLKRRTQSSLEIERGIQ